MKQKNRDSFEFVGVGSIKKSTMLAAGTTRKEKKKLVAQSIEIQFGGVNPNPRPKNKQISIFDINIH